MPLSNVLDIVEKLFKDRHGDFHVDLSYAVDTTFICRILSGQVEMARGYGKTTLESVENALIKWEYIRTPDPRQSLMFKDGEENAIV